MAITLINDISTTYFDRAYLCHDLPIKTDVLDSAQKAESSTDISCAEIYKPVILRKLGLSSNFPRSVLYSRKTALGVGLMAPRTIIDGLAMKLYVGHQRSEDRISKIIQIIEDNTSTQYGYLNSVIDTNREVKPRSITWRDEIQDKMKR